MSTVADGFRDACLEASRALEKLTLLLNQRMEESQSLKDHVLESLIETSRIYPELRVAQLIHNVTGGADIFYLSDHRLLALIEEWKKEHPR